MTFEQPVEIGDLHGVRVRLVQEARRSRIVGVHREMLFQDPFEASAVAGRRIVGGVAVLREQQVRCVDRRVLGADERVIEVVSVGRAPERARQGAHPVADEAELVRRDPVVRAAAHAYDRRVPEQATRDEGRASALHAEDEDRPVERDPVHARQPLAEGEPPPVASSPAFGLDQDRPRRTVAGVGSEEIGETSKSGRHSEIVTGAPATLSRPESFERQLGDRVKKRLKSPCALDGRRSP